MAMSSPRAEPEIRPVTDADWPAITSIFNHFVAKSFAAYPDVPVRTDFFRSRQLASSEYPFVVAESDGEVVGFGYLAPFHAVATMRRSAQLTYFILPDHTGHGLGTRMLELLIAEGRRLGVRSFLAHISSLNEGSIRFHRRHGFSECGRFLEVGEKHGRLFDMVWVQRLEA